MTKLVSMQIVKDKTEFRLILPEFYQYLDAGKRKGKESKRNYTVQLVQGKSRRRMIGQVDFLILDHPLNNGFVKLVQTAEDDVAEPHAGQ